MTSAMTSYLMLCLLLTIVTVLKLSTALVIPLNAGNVSPQQQQRLFRHSLLLNVMTDREADFVEQMVGGERYSMIPLPDSMTDTTLFVGNLCEFVSDDDLSRLFQTVSALHSLPACVARKPNTQSLEYGFVAFPTIEEKEAAIIRFNGFCYKGRSLRVQPIIDRPKQGRVRVPERLVAYVSGDKKGLRRYNNNNMSRDKRDSNNRSRDSLKRPTRSNSSSRNNSSRGVKGQPSSHRSSSNKRRTFKLSDQEQSEFDRACRKGFLTLTAGRRHYSADSGRHNSNKGGSSSSSYSLSPLVKKHRQWCDARGKPQIVLLKAVGCSGVGGGGGSRSNTVLDQVCIDLSPLRLPALFDDPRQAADIWHKWKTEIVLAASNAGMECLESSSSTWPSLLDEKNKEDSSNAHESSYGIRNEQRDWATDPIFQLPVLRLGTFLGERSKAKEMTKALAKLWDIPEQQQQQQEQLREHDTTTSQAIDSNSNDSKERRLRYKNQRRRPQHPCNSKHLTTTSSVSSTTTATTCATTRKGKRPKVTKGLSEHRKRGGGHRQSWY